MSPEMLQDRPIRQAIQLSARGFTAKVDPIIRDINDTKQKALRQDLTTFAGFKTYHHLGEVAELARRADGSLKSWQEFQTDTRGIDDKYNRNWLQAEYAFIQSSAQMAEQWEQYAQWGDAYDLLYQTAGDEQVRADHALLEGMCLPFSDPAWNTCFPPNGWGCRCHVIQVIPGSYPRSNSDEMIHILEDMTPDRQEMFRFNPGKEGRLIPKTHPYFGKNGYDHCRTTKLAGNLEPDEECEIYYNLLREEYDQEGYASMKSPSGNDLKVHIDADLSEVEDNIRTGFALVDEYPDLEVKVREHVTIHGEKNAEYLINGLLGDAKRVQSSDGITSGFKAAKKQGCRYVIIDYDKEKRGKKISYKKTAKELANRASVDFDTGIIIEVFVVHNNRVVRFDKNTIREPQKMIEEMIEKGL